MRIRMMLSGMAPLLLSGGVALAQTSAPSGASDQPAETQAGESNQPSAAPAQPGTAAGGNEAENAPAPAPGSMEAGGTAGGMAAPGAAVPRGQVPFEATKHVAVVDAGLVGGAMNANLLKQITAHPASYDQDHGRLFLTNIKQAVTQAEAHLNHLRPISTGKAASKLQDIQARLDRVKDMLPKMEGELGNPKTLGVDAGRVSDELHSGIAPLKDVSKALQAKVQFRSIG